MSQEIKFYQEILGEYCDLKDHPNIKEAWKVNSIIKLMNLAKKRDDNKEFVQSGLLIIMHLATGKYHDEIEESSRNLRDLMENEKQFVITSLKHEFNLN